MCVPRHVGRGGGGRREQRRAEGGTVTAMLKATEGNNIGAIGVKPQYYNSNNRTDKVIHCLILPFLIPCTTTVNSQSLCLSHQGVLLLAGSLCCIWKSVSSRLLPSQLFRDVSPLSLISPTILTYHIGLFWRCLDTKLQLTERSLERLFSNGTLARRQSTPRLLKLKRCTHF